MSKRTINETSHEIITSQSVHVTPYSSLGLTILGNLEDSITRVSYITKMGILFTRNYACIIRDRDTRRLIDDSV